MPPDSHSIITAVEAATEERNRLARELHDSLGYTLTISMVQLENAAKLICEEPKEAQQIIETVRDRLASGVSDLRTTVTSLRDHKIVADELLATLQRLISEFSATTGIVVHARLPKALPALSDAEATALFRATQEALVNSFKHGPAEEVSMRLEIEDDILILNVVDYGQRYAPSAGSGSGLAGVKERVDRVGGSLLVNRAPEGDVSLTVRLPLKGVTYA